jgi:nitrogen regulatory protein P-II 2
MQMIVAVIKPFRRGSVCEALTEIYRGAEYAANFLAKVKVEIAVASEIVEAALKAIRRSVRTGRIGDRKIFVLDLNRVVRIRTGETDSAVL